VQLLLGAGDHYRLDLPQEVKVKSRGDDQGFVFDLHQVPEEYVPPWALEGEETLFHV
jgi:hypothetical protein